MTRGSRMAAVREWVRRLWGTLRRNPSDRDLDRELRLHLELAEEDLLGRGHSATDAKRLARVRFGGSVQAMEALRDQRGVPWLDTFWLDVKLGVRMLRKSWGLTLVGGLAMTVVIGIAAGTFNFLQTTFASSVPLDEGDRVVALMAWDSTANRRQNPALRDFDRWRDELRLVENVSGFRTVERRLATSDAPSDEFVFIAEMTATGFELARVPPLLGRPIVADDERDGATPVVVIGHDVWHSRFSGDRSVVGQTFRLGGIVHIVVGVMPEGFAFPVNHHLWTPLPARVSNDTPSRQDESEVFVFARLAPSVTLEGAQAELTTVGLLPSAAGPETRERLHPRVVPYTLGLTSSGDGEEPWVRGLILLLVTLLLIPPCANIAILIYARTVTRQEEFAARYALGASRARIVGQLFVETLVLAAGAAGVALVLVRLFFRYVPFLGPDDPFWMDYGDVSFTTVLFAAGLAVVAALIAGVAPALRATGRLMQSGLRALGGRTGMQLGSTWTALVVAQIAFSVAVLPSTVEFAWGTLRPGILGPGFPAEEFLTARLTTTRETSPGVASRFSDHQAELVRRLEAEPGVSAVTVSAAVPGWEPFAFIELDGIAPRHAISEDRRLAVGGTEQLSGLVETVQFLEVDDVFFEVFDVPLLTGRGFGPEDFGSESTAVLVNREFVRQLVGDRNPLGLRVRYVTRVAGENLVPEESAEWYEIVGVVADLPANTGRRKMYHPAPPGQTHPVRLALHVGPAAAGLPGRLRDIAAALDPTLRVDQLRALDDIYREIQTGNNLGTLLIATVMLSVLLLSAAGQYALMSFTVAHRRREIGIRAALGAQPRRLLAGIFRRALGQVATGAVVGILAALLLGVYVPVEEMGGWELPGILPGAAALMFVIGLLAAAGPARRGLRVDPTEALREG